MKRKIIALFLSVALLFSVACPIAFADVDLSTHTHTWVDTALSFDMEIKGISITVKVKKCEECGWYLHTANVLGLQFSYPSIHQLRPLDGEIVDALTVFVVKALGNNVAAKPYQTGGGSAGTGGVGRRPSGYTDDTGTPSVSPTGAYTVSAPLRLYPLGINGSSGTYVVNSPDKIDNYSFTSGNIAIVGTPSGIKVTNGGSSDAYIRFGGGYRVNVSAAGYLSVASGVKAYTGMGGYRYYSDDAKELWSIEHLYRSSNKGVFGLSASKDTTYFVEFGIKGDSNYKTTSEFTSCGVSVSFHTITLSGSSNQFYSYPYWSTLWIPHNTETFLRYDSIPVSYVMNTTSISQTNNITINKNTWNGNIYQDNSTNLTYIYPQYTTVNENNETVTNISNNPIIYNSETKEYYTYDSVTNNYYYITYEQPATPSPSPSPGPGSTSTPESGSGGGSGSGSGGSSGGQSWWEKLLSKIGDAIIDGLLGAVSAVLKLIFKLFSTILGWIIWAVSRVFDLLPFLPPGLGGLLVGGVVVCFIIGLIKFIRG